MQKPLELIPSYKPHQQNKPLFVKRSLTIGKFDACHLGHQELIKNILAFSPKSLMPTVPSFARQKASVAYKNQLFSTEQQLRMFEEINK